LHFLQTDQIEVLKIAEPKEFIIYHVEFGIYIIPVM